MKSLCAMACAGSLLAQTQPGPLQETQSANPVNPPGIESPQSSPALVQTQRNQTIPAKESSNPDLDLSLFRLGSAYTPQKAPPLSLLSGTRLGSLIHNGTLYLSLRDALALAIENNLNVEVQRYDLSIASTDVLRTKGGGTTRGVDYTVTEASAGVGGPGSPLLNAAAVSVSPTSPTIVDLTSLNSVAETPRSLSVQGSSSYSLGPDLPILDPQFIADLGWLRRDDATNLTSLSGVSGGTPSAVDTTPYNNTTASASYLQGFGPGTQLQANVNNSAEALYPNQSLIDPFHSPTISVQVTQPLLRGRGRDVNLRYLRIAQINQKVSRLVFRQQLLSTVYGVARLYFDLVSLVENARVKEDTLAAARKLYSDDVEQVNQGTLPPLELTRAQALVSSSELDLIQAQGLVSQEQIILKNQLARTGPTDPLLDGVNLVPTDTIEVPPADDVKPVPQLVREALDNRPDLAQAYLEVSAGKEAATGAENNVRPELDLYASMQTRGAGQLSYLSSGQPGTGIVPLPGIPAGGLRVDRIFEAGIQLDLPVRNRVARADAARDLLTLRQSQARTQLLQNQVSTQVKAALVALATARSEYNAAIRSRVYQDELLQAERDKYAVGASTNLLIVENESYFSQARSTEVAAKSNWIKARIALDQSLGDLLEKYNILYQDAVDGRISTVPGTSQP